MGHGTDAPAPPNREKQEEAELDERHGSLFTVRSDATWKARASQSGRIGPRSYWCREAREGGGVTESEGLEGHRI